MWVIILDYDYLEEGIFVRDASCFRCNNIQIKFFKYLY